MLWPGGGPALEVTYLLPWYMAVLYCTVLYCCLEQSVSTCDGTRCYDCLASVWPSTIIVQDGKRVQSQQDTTRPQNGEQGKPRQKQLLLSSTPGNDVVLSMQSQTQTSRACCMLCTYAPMNPTLSAPEPSAAIAKHLIVAAELTRTPIAGLHAPEAGDKNASTLPDSQAAIAARADARIIVSKRYSMPVLLTYKS